MPSWTETLLLDFLAGLSSFASVVLGGVLAIIAGYYGAHHAGKLQTKRDDSQRLHDIVSLRKALRSELLNLWETYKEDTGNQIEQHDQMTNPFSPDRDYAPNLRHCPVLMGVSSKIGLLNPQELDLINRTYATLSRLQHTFEVVDARRKEQEMKPLGQDTRGYKESLSKREKHARENIHALHSAAKLWVTTTLNLLDRPLDERGNPVGPAPFENGDPQDVDNL